MNLKLRPYQEEAIAALPESGAVLERLATGLGKTVIFSNIPRQGRMLCLSHREELVRQPAKYFDCCVGFERAEERSNGEEVVLASVQSLVRRLDRFRPDDFDIIVTDEAHHAAAKTYRKIYDYFRPRLHVGFTATPNRGDKVRLDDIYSDIVYDRDLVWGIKNGYLSDIFCQRADIGYDLRGVATRLGDYAPGELDQAVNIDACNKAIAEVYRDYAVGQTVIFATSVSHAEAIADLIPGAVVVSAKTKNRAEIIADFTARKIPCLVNCMIFTEGTDIPLIETVIIARPTKNDALYTQMVGRGLRLHPDKDKLHLIDCVGTTKTASLCTAPSLLGINLEDVPAYNRDMIKGDLFELEDKVARFSDCPESWIRNMEIVDLWAQEQKYETHDINFFKLPNGDLKLMLPDMKPYIIPSPDELGRTEWRGNRVGMQQALDELFKELTASYEDLRKIWDKRIVNKWGKAPATEKQLKFVRRLCRNVSVPSGLTKSQANMIITRLTNERKRKVPRRAN